MSAGVFGRLAQRLGERAREERDIDRDQRTLLALSQQRAQQDQFAAQSQLQSRAAAAQPQTQERAATRAFNLQRAGRSVMRRAQTPTATGEGAQVLTGLDGPGASRFGQLNDEQRNAAQLFREGLITRAQLGKVLLDPGVADDLRAVNVGGRAVLAPPAAADPQQEAVESIIMTLPEDQQQFASALRSMPPEEAFDFARQLFGQEQINRRAEATQIDRRQRDARRDLNNEVEDLDSRITSETNRLRDEGVFERTDQIIDDTTLARISEVGQLQRRRAVLEAKKQSLELERDVPDDIQTLTDEELAKLLQEQF